MRYMTLTALALALAPMGWILADEPGPDTDGGSVIYDGRKEMDELPRLADQPKHGDDVIVPAYNPPRDRVVLRAVHRDAGWVMPQVEPAAAPEPYVVRTVAMADAMATPAPVWHAASARRAALLGSGFYAGVSGGSSRGEASFNHAALCNKANYQESKKFGAVQAGYLASHGNWRIGPELSLQLGGGMEADVSCPVGSASCHSKVEDMASLGMRAGYMLGPVMPYAIVGAATGKVSAQVGSCSSSVSGGPCTPKSVSYKASSASDEDWRSGLMYGAGLEGFLSPKLSVRAEWGKVDLESSSLEVSGKTVEVDNQVEAIKIGANYHF